MRPTKKVWIVAALAVAATGCAASDESMIVLLGAVPWEPQGGQGGMGGGVVCTTPASPDPLSPGGRFDVNINGDPAVTPSFYQGFVIENQLPPVAHVGAGQLELNTFVVEHATVEYAGLDEATTQLLQGLTTEVPVGASVKPGGILGLPLTLIPTNIAQVMRDQLVPNPNDLRTIIATVQVVGHTVGQTPVKSSTMSWPVDVCNGCLDLTACVADIQCACGHFR